MEYPTFLTATMYAVIYFGWIIIALYFIKSFLNNWRR